MELYLNLFHGPLWLQLFAATTLGLLIGSFLNVLIHRLPLMLNREWYHAAKEYLDEIKAPPDLPDVFNLVLPNSRCPKCQVEIKPWQNIPVISYLLLKGKCGQCKTSIPKRYPIVEAITGILTALIIWKFGFTAMGGCLLIFLWSLITLSLIDFDHKLLPDNITIPLIWIGLLVNSQGIIVSLEDALYGAILGYLSLWSVYWVFKLVTKKEGMGYGDFKLLSAMGAWLGWQAIPSIILLSSGVGAIVGIIIITCFGHDKNVGMPFGPYLAAAGLLTLFFGKISLVIGF